MYEAYWRLKQKPFENAADPKFYYPGESHQAALLKLRYAVENRRGGALLAGQSGTGKTLITTMLPEVLGEAYSPAVRLVFPRMSTTELIGYIADELEGAAGGNGGQGLQANVKRIEHFLAENSREGLHAVVVIAEAHLLDGMQTFESLRLLLNFEYDGAPGMSLLLVGDPAILPTLDRMPQWEERLGVKCILRPFNEAETAAYVEHRLRAAGADRSIVDPDAMPTLHALTNGIARRINRLCDLALLIGFAEERKKLDASHFESVCQELVAVVPE